MVHCSHKGMNMVSNNTQEDCGVLNDAQLVLTQSVPRKYPPHHYTTSTSITPPPAWNAETRQDGSMLSCSLGQIRTLPSEYRSRNRDSSDQATFYNLLLSNFVEPVWIVVSVSCSYLTGAATRCGLLLLEHICFRVRRVVCSEMVFCRSWL